MDSLFPNLLIAMFSYLKVGKFNFFRRLSLILLRWLPPSNNNYTLFTFCLLSKPLTDTDAVCLGTLFLLFEKFLAVASVPSDWFVPSTGFVEGESVILLLNVQIDMLYFSPHLLHEYCFLHDAAEWPFWRYTKQSRCCLTSSVLAFWICNF